MKRIWPCLFGLRCAQVEITLPTDLPAGITAVVEYTCGSCGTHYRGNGWTRKRVKA